MPALTESPYQTIKRCIADEIARGAFAPGQMLPSEHALCDRFGVSRMTVNRAMRELAAESLVRRVPGVGSFVSPPVAQSALVEIHNIAAEIEQRGHAHSAEVRLMEQIEASAAEALDFDIAPGAALFHSVILHFEDGAPLQLEDRLVNPAAAPLYLQQDFQATTPNEYLSKVAPLDMAEHDVQAVKPPSQIAFLLALDNDEPCLLVTRRTWSRERRVTTAKLCHPGNRFRLTGRFFTGKGMKP
jgi:GntR family histidine utilization transcriptional repressor